MKSKSIRASAVLVGLALLAGACGGDDDSTASTATDVASDDSSQEETSEEENSDDASSDAEGSSDDESSVDESSVDESSDEAVPSDVDRDATLVYGATWITSSLDMPNTSSDFTYLHLNPIYDSLTTRTPSGEIAPGIAESWELTEDALTLTIAEGRSFHDGQPLDAEAVEANLERIINCECRLAPNLDAVSSMEVSGNQLTLNLSSPSGSLIEVLSDLTGMMASPASFDNEDIDTNPVGSGPFVVREYSDGSILYDRWDDYYAADDTLVANLEIVGISDDNTRLAGVIGGEVDIAFARLPQLEEAEAQGLEIIKGPATASYLLGLEGFHPALDIPDVRKAITHAIDREGISQGLFNGECLPSVQPYPEGFPGFAPEATVEAFGAFDPDLSRQLLADAGFPDGFTMTISSAAAPTYSSLLEVVQAQLAEVGIVVEPTISENSTHVALLSSGEWDSWISPVPTARPSTTAFWQLMYHPDGARNSGDYALPGIDEMLLELESASSDGRAEVLEELTMASLEEGPRGVILCLPKDAAVFQSDVGGYELPLAGNWSLRSVYKEV